MNARATPSLGLDTATSPGGGGSLLGWTVLVLAGLTAVAAAGWYGHSLQQAPERAAPEATDAASAPDHGAVSPRTPAFAASGAVPARVSPPPPAASARGGAPAAAGKAVPPAASASQPVLTWPLWEFQLRQPIPPRDPPLTPPSWRLIGATQTRDGWKVVVLRQGTTIPEYFGIGAMLPGGYKIRAITEEDVTFDINKREVILSYTGSR